MCHSFNEFAAKILETENSENFTLIYQFDVEEADQNEEFNHALRVLWYRGNVFILVEEVQNFASTHNMPHWLRQALFTGRHRNLGLGFTTQRPGECHKSIISQAGHCFFGSLHEKNDLEYCKTVLGPSFQLLPTLPERHFLYFRPSHPILLLKPDGSFSPPPQSP
jgi:DNA helicase HerA-like ATPase